MRKILKTCLVLAILPLMGVAPYVSGDLKVLTYPVAVAATDNFPKKAALPVKVDKIVYQDSYIARESYAGKIGGARSSRLGFEQGGLLAEIVAQEGIEVEAGSVLARLDQRALNAERLEIEARLQGAQAQIVQLEAELALAERTEKRREQLLKNDNTSRQSYDEATFGRRSIAAQLDAAKANAAQAAAQLDANAVRLDLSELKAPYAGAITVRFLDEGTVVQPGQSVVEIVEYDRLELRVGLPEMAARKLEIGYTYQVRASDDDFSVRLLRVVNQISDATRTVTAIFSIDDERLTLKDGAIGRLMLERRNIERGFWLPLTALTEGRRGLWNAYAVVDQTDGRFVIELRPVDILYAEIDRAYVRGAFDNEESFLKTGIHRVIPGMHVRPDGVGDTAPALSLLN